MTNIEYTSAQGEVPDESVLATLALNGLRSSIEAGYLTEVRARIIFTHYFPEQVELLNE